MRDLLLELKASTNGEPFRLVATGVRPMGGGTKFSTAKPLPQELLRALNHNLDEFDPSVGTWNHTCMKTHKLPAGGRLVAGSVQRNRKQPGSWSSSPRCSLLCYRYRCFQ